MSYKCLNDFVAFLADQENFTGDLMDLNDYTKDTMVAIWLVNHGSWMTDIFPHTAGENYHEAMMLTYPDNLDCEGLRRPSLTLAQLFRQLAVKYKEYCDGDAYWSEAAEDFEEILDEPDFEEQMRNRIYLYMEKTLREKVQDSYDDYLTQGQHSGMIH